MNLQSIVTDIS